MSGSAISSTTSSSTERGIDGGDHIGGAVVKERARDPDAPSGDAVVDPGGKTDTGRATELGSRGSWPARICSISAHRARCGSGARMVLGPGERQGAELLSGRRSA